MKNIGIFIFIGILSVLCHEQGWFPNEDIYAISQLAYKTVLPFVLAYEGGQMAGGAGGGIQAVLAVSGVLVADPAVGFFSGMLLGPLSGWLWKKEEMWIRDKAGASVQMLVKNLSVGVTGAVLALCGFYLLAPALSVLGAVVSNGVDWIVAHRLLGFLNILIEPAKVFFLNNMMEYSILVPIGMSQVQNAGSSVLFLLETNPGPGLGVLLALYLREKERRSEYGSAIIAEAAGGIHEVYFTCVLSDLKLLIPLILGGMAGTFCFEFLEAGVQAAVSPGSIIILLLLAGKNQMLPVLIGIIISTLVSLGISLLLLGKNKKNVTKTKEETMPHSDFGNVHTIVFVCDGGVGSSAMGAALFRRMLAQEKLTDIQAEACAVDLVPPDVDLIVCQKAFYTYLPEEIRKEQVYQVDSLVKSEDYRILLEQIKKGRGD